MFKSFCFLVVFGDGLVLIVVFALAVVDNQQKMCFFFTAANECDTPPVVPEIGSE